MKLIRMKTSSASPMGSMAIGQVYLVDNSEAKALVDGGYAEYAEVPTLEKATKKEEPEKAVKPEAEHIGGGWYEYNGEKMRKADLPKGVL